MERRVTLDQFHSEQIPQQNIQFYQAVMAKQLQISLCYQFLSHSYKIVELMVNAAHLYKKEQSREL
jgi:hypothetical protein